MKAALFGLIPVLLVVAFVGSIVLLIVLAYQRAKKRRELFARFAYSNGWIWTAQDDSFAKRWAGSPFGKGDHRRAHNVVQGLRAGRPIVAFDYSYQTHSTDGQGHTTTTTHRYSVCGTAMPARVPSLQVTPEGAMSRIGHALGLHDIELESEDFNRRFRVTCQHPKFASDVLHPRQMIMLMHKGFASWRMEGSDRLCWMPGQHSPTQVLAGLQLLAEILDGIPSFVWRDLGVAPERTGRLP